MAKIYWIQTGGAGYIAIGHKPGGKISFRGLKFAGASVVLTLMQEHEGAQHIGDQLKQLNIEWIWFQLSASNAPSGKRTGEVYKLFEYLEQSLKNGNKIYLHCSGGIHRTGMITYGLLRYLGKEKEEAVEVLHDLRVVTAVNIKEELLQWGDQFCNKKTY